MDTSSSRTFHPFPFSQLSAEIAGLSSTASQLFSGAPSTLAKMRQTETTSNGGLQIMLVHNDPVSLGAGSERPFTWRKDLESRKDHQDWSDNPWRVKQDSSCQKRWSFQDLLRMRHVETLCDVRARFSCLLRLQFLYSVLQSRLRQRGGQIQLTQPIHMLMHDSQSCSFAFALYILREQYVQQ